MGAIRRKTAIAKELENFLDWNEKEVSADVWDALEKVAESIDSMADDLDDEINDLNAKVKELEIIIEDLEAGE